MNESKVIIFIKNSSKKTITIHQYNYNVLKKDSILSSAITITNTKEYNRLSSTFAHRDCFIHYYNKNTDRFTTNTLPWIKLMVNTYNPNNAGFEDYIENLLFNKAIDLYYTEKEKS